jgi:hypothetical protein
MQTLQRRGIRWEMKGGARGKGGQKVSAGTSSSSKAWLNEVP